jgi:Zn-dependent peptidase ImmA (M78 family)
MRSAWDPWLDLSTRRHIVFELDRIAKIGGGALYARRGAHAAIVIDPDLSSRDQRAALAHELVHDERGGIADHGGAPGTWTAVVRREERTVDAIAAQRLVPLDQLEDWARRRSTIGPILLVDVADEFDVPDRVALVAVGQLRQRPRGGKGVGPNPDHPQAP